MSASNFRKWMTVARACELVSEDIISLFNGSIYCYYYCHSLLLSEILFRYWCNRNLNELKKLASSENISDELQNRKKIR